MFEVAEGKDHRGDKEWKVVSKGKGGKNQPNYQKNYAQTSNKDQGNNNNPTTSRNPYVVLGVIEGVDRENVEYNTIFSKNDAIDMEVNEEIGVNDEGEMI